MVVLSLLSQLVKPVDVGSLGLGLVNISAVVRETSPEGKDVWFGCCYQGWVVSHFL